MKRYTYYLRLLPLMVTLVGLTACSLNPNNKPEIEDRIFREKLFGKYQGTMTVYQPLGKEEQPESNEAPFKELKQLHRYDKVLTLMGEVMAVPRIPLEHIAHAVLPLGTSITSIQIPQSQDYISYYPASYLDELFTFVPGHCPIKFVAKVDGLERHISVVFSAVKMDNKYGEYKEGHPLTYWMTITHAKVDDFLVTPPHKYYFYFKQEKISSNPDPNTK